MAGRGKGKGKGGKGFGKGKGGADREASRDADAAKSGPLKMYPDHPKLPKPIAFTEAQKSLLVYCREMEQRYRKNDCWAEKNVAQRLGVVRWSDKFRVDGADRDFFKKFAPNERYFPAGLCRSEPPPSKKRKRNVLGDDDVDVEKPSLDQLEKMEASGVVPLEQEEADDFSDDEQEGSDNEFDDDFEFDYEDDGEVGLGDADCDAEL